MTRSHPQLIAAAPVSFKDDGQVDISGTSRIFESIAATIGDALVLGTTGEFPALRSPERRSLVELAIDVLGPERAVIHVGYPSMFQVRQDLEHALAAGAQRIALLTPYYLPVGQDAVVAFYQEVAAELDDQHELFAYVFEQRSGIDLTAETLARIAEIPHVAGVKVSGKTLGEIAAFQGAVPASFQVFTGADADIVAGHRQGLSGVISGVSAVVPRPFQALLDAIESGDAEGAVEYEGTTQAIVRTIDGRIAALKRILELRGIASARMRMPSDPLDGPSELALRRIVEEWA